MRVVEGTIGGIAFTLRSKQDQKSSSTQQSSGTSDNGEECTPQDDVKDSKELLELLKRNEQIRDVLAESIAINSTAFEEHMNERNVNSKKADSGRNSKKGPNSTKTAGSKEMNGDDNGPKFVGNKTECALLRMMEVDLAEVKKQHYADIRESADIVLMLPFSSTRKAMATVVKLDDGKYRLYVKGAAEVVVGLCTKRAKLGASGEQSTEDLTKDGQLEAQKLIETYAQKSLRTIALAYRDFEEWPPRNAQETSSDTQEGGQGDTRIKYEAIAIELTLLALPGIQDPLREGIKEAVDNCRIAGVQVKMCTGDNIMTAKFVFFPQSPRR